MKFNLHSRRAVTVGVKPGPALAMARTSLTALAALLAIAMGPSCAEATDCTKTPDLLENCDQWTACVKSAGVGCYNPYSHPCQNCL